MATIEEGLTDFLQGEITHPVYPQNFPQRKRNYPCVTYSKRQGGREYNLIAKIGIEHPVFDLDVFGETYPETVEAAAEIKEAINGYRGEWSNGTIHNVIVRNLVDAPPERKGASDQHVFHQTIEVEIWYSRP